VTNALDNQIQGGRGLDIVVWEQARDQYQVLATTTGWEVQDTLGQEGVDRVQAVERLVFSDSALALDLDGHAGTVAKTLGAVFGAESVRQLEFVGIGLLFMDEYGYSAESLMQLAMDEKLGRYASHDQVVNLLYTQVVGQPPSAEVRQSFVSLLDSKVHSVGSLGVLAANTDINRTNIDLVGLAQTGLAYLPIEV
jgi:hypothetical protein